MRLLTAILLSLTLTACGQSGALYFPKSEPAKSENAKQESSKPAERSDSQDKENADSTTGP